MFNDINEVRLLGNITNDPDLRFTPSGSAVLSFGVATNRRYKKGEEWVDDVTYHNIVVWGQKAQSLAQRVRKGTRLFVSGRLQTRSWDGQDGKKQYKTEIVSDDISLVSRYNEGPMSGGAATEAVDPASIPGMKSAASLPQPEAPMGDDVEINPDELPF